MRVGCIGTRRLVRSRRQPLPRSDDLGILDVDHPDDDAPRPEQQRQFQRIARLASLDPSDGMSL